jgi:DNA gyrase inhibitor GyrI
MKLSLFLAALLNLVFIGHTMAYDEPQYKVIFNSQHIEIRQYAPMLVAQVYVDGDMDEASNKGFRLIASYIFGNNQAATQPESEKIAMTTPVTIEPQAEKISMTAPVAIEPQSQEGNMATSQRWRVHFVMPSQYTLSSIPKPKDSSVKLREIPEQYFVALRYSGFNTTAKVQQRTDELRDWSTSQGLTLIGGAQLARYNPPWTLPMFRRNEILIEIAKPDLSKMKPAE